MRRIKTRNSAAKQTRREQGEVRNASFRALSFLEQVAVLDQRLGVNVGAKRQRAKLALALAEVSSEPVKSTMEKK